MSTSMNPEISPAMSDPLNENIPAFLQPLEDLQIGKENLSQVIARVVLICPDKVIPRGDERDQLPAPRTLVLELRPDSSIVSANMYTLAGGKVKEKHFPGGNFAAKNLEQAGRSAVLAKIQEELGINLSELFSNSGLTFSTSTLKAEGFFENPDVKGRTWTTLVYSLVLPEKPSILMSSDLGGVVFVNERVFLQESFTDEDKERWALFIEELNYLTGHFPAITAVLRGMLLEKLSDESAK